MRASSGRNGRMKLSRFAPLAAAAMLAAAPAMAADQTMKIGIAASLTGSLAAYSESEGARCMADKINKAAGPGDPRIAVMVEDNRSDPHLSVWLGQKFIDDRAQVIAGVPCAYAL